MALEITIPTREGSGDNSIRARARSKSPFQKKNQIPFKSLASEDSLGNSKTSRSMDDEGIQSAFDDLSKRTHSLASTATLTSNESSMHSHNNSFRNSKWSPTSFKSPRKSPRRAFLLSDLSSETKKIGSLPLTPNANGQALEGDRGIVKNSKRVGGPPTDGTYYQPSKASLGQTDQSSKKPQRIRNRSKGPLLRRKSNEDTKTTSERSDRTSSRGKSCEPKEKNVIGTTTRSKSCDRKDTTMAKKKNSPSIRLRKKPSSSRSVEKPSSSKTAETEVTTSTLSLHESWPRPSAQEAKIAEKQKHRIEKIKATDKSKKIKHIPKTKKKESKDKIGGKSNCINEVITFFEEFAARKPDSERSSGPPPREMGEKGNGAKNLTRRSHSPTARSHSPTVRRSHSPTARSHSPTARSHSPTSRRPKSLSKYSNGDPSERTTRRSLSPTSKHPRSPLKYSTGDSAEYATPSDQEIMGTSNKRRQRRSSAPAKAMTAFKQCRQSKIEDFDDVETMPLERVLLDVSELAALEIIRLGKDNSLKLDLFDLMKHLKSQQLNQTRL